MSKRQQSESSELVNAATAIEEELRRFESLAEEVRTGELRSQKHLEKMGKLLTQVANVLNPTVPHLVWSATTTTSRLAAMKDRLVSASIRFGVLSPCSASTPCAPRNNRSRCSEASAAVAIGPTNASEGVRIPPIRTTVRSERLLPWNTSAIRAEFVTTVKFSTRSN